MQPSSKIANKTDHWEPVWHRSARFKLAAKAADSVVDNHARKDNASLKVGDKILAKYKRPHEYPHHAGPALMDKNTGDLIKPSDHKKVPFDNILLAKGKLSATANDVKHSTETPHDRSSHGVLAIQKADFLKRHGVQKDPRWSPTRTAEPNKRPSFTEFLKKKKDAIASKRSSKT
jgi:hypothetical protein